MYLNPVRCNIRQGFFVLYIQTKTIKAMDKNISIDNLIIELTRRCNMQCSHCLRGKAQKKDMSIETMDKIFKNVDSIRTLGLGGGENSLKPENINNLIDSLKRNNVTVYDFYIVTNAKRLTQPFFNAVENLYNYCNDNEISSINWSNDNFHEEVNYRNLEKLENFKDLMMYKYNAPDYIVSSKWGDHKLSYDRLITMGNATYIGQKNLKIYKYNLEIDENYTDINDTMVYISCNGNVHPSCDLSYNLMDNYDKTTLGNVHDENFDFVKAAIKWNNEFENDNAIEINELDLIYEGIVSEVLPE